jgi:hypothetical protein
VSGKLNPLFLDSTKGYGESVGTRIELSGPSLQPGERVFIRIQDQFGRDQVIPLAVEQNTDEAPIVSAVENLYVGRIWLTHQQRIHYQFFIEKNDLTVSSSEQFESIATHMIIESWSPPREEAQPIASTPQAENTTADTSTQTHLDTSTPNETLLPQTDSFQDLIIKWGL